MRAGVVVLMMVGACATARVPPASLPSDVSSSQVVVLMLDMTDLALEWEFFDAHSDSIGAGVITARSRSWCARIPIPAGAETARLFNGLEDMALSPASHPYWTLHLRGSNAFVPERAPPC